MRRSPNCVSVGDDVLVEPELSLVGMRVPCVVVGVPTGAGRTWTVENASGERIEATRDQFQVLA